MYFNQGYIDYFRELENNNNKAWFKDNKKWYELAVREPFKAFIDDLLPEVLQLDSTIRMEAKDAVFRINNDLRFSKDDTPYKTHMAAGFSRGGRKSSFAGFYLQIGHKDMLIGGGLPFPEKETLRKIRMEIGHYPDEFQSIIENQEFKYLYGSVLGENNKVVPRSFASVYEDNPLIANKQYYYGTLYHTEDWLFSNNLITHIIGHFRVGIPFNNFLINAIDNFSTSYQNALPTTVDI